MDWRQLWEICSAPDNVPIVGLIPLLAFYIFLAWKQAHANDQLIEQLEGDAALAKTHHRKTWPFKPGWQKEVHVWPFLLRIEFLAAIIVTIILMVWSITLNAPLEEPANPNLTMNPAKAPWYFLGLQEMLDYDHRRADGDSVYRYESAGQRLLHLEAAQIFYRDVLVRFHRSVGRDDPDWDLHPRPRLAVVLARANLGSQPADIRSEPRFAGHFWHHFEPGEGNFRRDCGGRLLPAWRIHRLFAFSAIHGERFQANEFAAVFDYAISIADHGGIAFKDGAAAALAHQVCVDYALVQYLSFHPERSQ
jgi:hypothetical protein